MDTKRTLEQVIHSFSDFDIETRIAILNHNLIDKIRTQFDLLVLIIRKFEDQLTLKIYTESL